MTFVCNYASMMIDVTVILLLLTNLQELRGDTSPEEALVATAKSSTLRKTADTESGLKSADADLMKITRASKYGTEMRA